MTNKHSTELIDSDDAAIREGIAACLEELDNAVGASRARWALIGRGLLAGRHKYPSDKVYGQWIKTTPFTRLKDTSRQDALWLSTQQGLLSSLPEEVAHPTHIRQWFREQKDTTVPLAPEDTTIDRLLVNAAKVAGKERGILAKSEHAKADTPEGRNAKRMLDRQAAALGMTADEAVASSAAQMPRVTPGNQKRYEDVLKGLDQLTKTYTAVLMHNRDLGLTPELIAIRVYNALKAAK